MSTPYIDLSNVLKKRLAIISDRAAYQNDPQGHLVRLQAVSEQIQILQGRLPLENHPQLKHYLERCSYDKALAYIDELTIQ